jgi:hypothetical protein
MLPVSLDCVFFLLPLRYSLNVFMGLELLFIFKLTVFSTLQTILIQPIYTTQCKLIFVDYFSSLLVSFWAAIFIISYQMSIYIPINTNSTKAMKLLQWCNG